ncbi:pyridoxamine 5'-phosphate oxidase family protein [Mycobacterium sp. 050272]|uniref:pyridoxamine 5'-phosphate oxidase family protein n=1 Tax=Mycobacterium sp. 050272 TaxID=3142488 RepID=UPI003190E26E
MTNENRPAAVGFHSGELAVQTRAGVRSRAERLAPMATRGQLRTATADFVAAAQLAVLTARDAAGRLWTSPLLGQPGFLRAATPTTLHIENPFPDADPLHDLPAGQPAGLIVIDFAARRRVRINGVLAQADSGGLAIDVDQAYGNCPKFIRNRHLRLSANASGPDRTPVFTGELLRPEDRQLIERADTFFLGTSHPTSGNDASHRGGPTGFVHIEHDRLWWPDYRGNNLFNSLGNVAVDPTTALLFIDFPTGTTLQLTGTATLVWDDDMPRDESQTGRRVTFTPQRVVVTGIPGLRAEF